MIEEILKSHLNPEENYIYGFANLTGLLENKFNGFNYGICIGRKLDNSVIDKITEVLTKDYYSHYNQVNEELSILIKKISYDLNKHNIETICIEPTVKGRDLETKYAGTLRADLSHKMVATRAGLGWIGKTDLFVSTEFGPRLRLSSILLKTEVKPKSKPIEESLCAACNICVDKCPAKAATGKLWDITIDRDEFFNAWSCQAKCLELSRKNLGFDARICGICFAVCPIGQKKSKL